MNKTIPSREELYHLYIEENMTREQLMDYYKCCHGTIGNWLRKYQISKPAELKVQAMQDTFIRKYGVTNPMMNEAIQQKGKCTCLLKYGVDNPFKSPEIQQKIKNTCVEKFGVDNVFKSQEFQDKAKETLKNKYGVCSMLSIPEVRALSQMPEAKEKRIKSMCESQIAHYGMWWFQTEEYKQIMRDGGYQRALDHQRETMKSQGKYDRSQMEEDYYNVLCNQFGTEDVIRQYKSQVYPFWCDFYVKSLDLYIEYNLYWTHGEHPYDESNGDDLNTLEAWKQKMGSRPRYKAAVEVWTTRDVNKLNTAIKNKLNYKMIYKEGEVMLYEGTFIQS